MNKSKNSGMKHIHRVKKILACGGTREYHYVFRGGPKFWDTSMGFGSGEPEYYVAYADHMKAFLPKKPVDDRKATAGVIARYLASAHFTKLASRTQEDYRKYLDSFESEFGDDPIKMFEEAESVSEIREWKEKWGHSLKQYDYATSVITKLLNWAKTEDAAIAVHHHTNVARLYKSNRADIVWLPEEVKALLGVANEREARIVVAASEGGLAPQDLGVLKRHHVQRTPKGRRLFFKRKKNGNSTSIPVTPALAALIDSTPAGQEFLVVSLEGHRLTPERASQIVRDLKARANKLASRDPMATPIREELRLYDLRGTAATALLRADCSLNQIAVTMGWGLRHAANIIERYAALVPEVADEVLAKLDAANARSKSEGEQ